MVARHQRSRRVLNHPMPKAPELAFAPSVDIDDSKKWILALQYIEEQPSKFVDKRKDATSLVHHWLVYDVDSGEAIEDDNSGELFELWQFTNDLTYDNPTTGKIAPAREIANALCGKRLTDDEVRDMLAAGWSDSLAGKKVLADLEWYTNNAGYQRLRVLRVKPYQKKARRKLDDDSD